MVIQMQDLFILCL